MLPPAGAGQPIKLGLRDPYVNGLRHRLRTSLVTELDHEGFPKRSVQKTKRTLFEVKKVRFLHPNRTETSKHLRFLTTDDYGLITLNVYGP